MTDINKSQLVDAGAAALDALTETEQELDTLKTQLRALAHETISKGQRLPDDMKLVGNAYVGSGQRMLRLLGEFVPDAASNPKLKEWWLSWYHSRASMSPFTYNGPWWISGGTFDDPPKDTIVAAVRAETASEAWEQIRASYDTPPPHLETRFCNEFEGSPYSDRFPRADWMQW